MNLMVLCFEYSFWCALASVVARSCDEREIPTDGPDSSISRSAFIVVMSAVSGGRANFRGRKIRGSQRIFVSIPRKFKIDFLPYIFLKRPKGAATCLYGESTLDGRVLQQALDIRRPRDLFIKARHPTSPVPLRHWEEKKVC